MLSFLDAPCTLAFLVFVGELYLMVSFGCAMHIACTCRI